MLFITLSAYTLFLVLTLLHVSQNTNVCGLMIKKSRSGQLLFNDSATPIFRDSDVQGLSYLEALRFGNSDIGRLSDWTTL